MRAANREADAMARARINGIELNYEVSGPDAATPVVLHHPLSTNLHSWDPLTAALDDTYRVVRMDARGHGRSEAPIGAYDFGTLKDDVIGLMDHLGIGTAHFVGLSMGGMAGQHLGIHDGARFKSLSLVSTSSAPAGAGPDVWDARIKLAREGGMAATVDGALERWVSDDARQNRPELIATITEMITSTPVDGFIGWCHAIGSMDISSEIAAIDRPTLVVVGALDPATPPAAAKVIHQQIKGSEYVELDGLSHMLQLEDPKRFHDVLLPFLAKY